MESTDPGVGGEGRLRPFKWGRNCEVKSIFRITFYVTDLLFLLMAAGT
jgi:hypothetical protein